MSLNPLIFNHHRSFEEWKNISKTRRSTRDGDEGEGGAFYGGRKSFSLLSHFLISRPEGFANPSKQ